MMMVLYNSVSVFDEVAYKETFSVYIALYLFLKTMQ